MVPIEERLLYINKIKSIPKVNLFHNLLNGKECNIDSSIVDKAYHGFVNSLLKNDEEEFRKNYEDFSRKKPSNESLWINDNFLIFVLLLGIHRYQIDKNWIREAITKRTTQKEEYLSINRTFLNILDENYQSNDNLFEIVLIFQNFLNLSLSTEQLNKVYNKISNNGDLFLSSNDFIICASIKSIDIIFMVKETPDHKEISNLRNFSSLFKQRVELVSKTIYYIILFSVIVLMIIYWNRFSDFFNSASVILGLFGASLLTFIKKVQKLIEKFILSILGYSKFFQSNK